MVGSWQSCRNSSLLTTPSCERSIVWNLGRRDEPKDPKDPKDPKAGPARRPARGLFDSWKIHENVWILQLMSRTNQDWLTNYQGDYLQKGHHWLRKMVPHQLTPKGLISFGHCFRSQVSGLQTLRKHHPSHEETIRPNIPPSRQRLQQPGQTFFVLPI